MNGVSLDALQIVLGGSLAIIAALFGLYMGWLNLPGAFAAFGIGSIVFGLGGLAWSVILLTFFLTSSILSVLFKSRKIEAEQYSAKRSRRDSGQVLANGGVACVFVVLHLFFPHQWWPWAGFAAACAGANADTWATEIGELSKRLPSMITSGKSVQRGTSGGISLAGTLGTAAGAGVVALAAWLLWTGPGKEDALLSIWFAGIAGSLVDSFLGATLQRVNFCEKCQKETEKTPYHSCGTATKYLRGWKWLDNDWVNFFCTLSAALVAILLVGG
jgi:uncharacterized protein (TIGR00297 family)